ncbi:MAG: hypothetical protein ACE5D1_02095 [Fidelibacterota bacterium]
MKIAYIAPENTVGSLTLWKKAHERRGNQCDYFTLYPSRNRFDNGFCLNLPLVSTGDWYLRGRHWYYRKFRGGEGDYREKAGCPPVWKPSNSLEAWYFKGRDRLWSRTVEPFIKVHDLRDYDLYHFEWGLEFYRDGRFAGEMDRRGKGIACTYHGQDLRTRGVIPEIDAVSRLNLTSELDLLPKHPHLDYLFLPVDTEKLQPRLEVGDPIRICHSPTNRYYKGSEDIIPACEAVARDVPGVEFVLIENRSYDSVLELKRSCDILVDQVHNRGGWGYGMNSVEALALGLVCVTELVPEYETFLKKHPFINVTAKTLYDKLLELVKNRSRLGELKSASRVWVENIHGLEATSGQLYAYYDRLGWLG